MNRLLLHRFSRALGAAVLLISFSLASVTPMAGASPSRRAAKKPPSPRPASATRAHRPASAAPARILYSWLRDDGRARVQFTDLLRMRGLVGRGLTSYLYASLPDGMLSGRASAQFARLRGITSGNAYVNIKPDRITGSGRLLLPSPGEGTQVDGSLESVQDGGAWDLQGHLVMDLPVDLSSVPLRAVTLMARSEGTYDKGASTMQLTIASSLISAYLPLRRLTLRIDDDGETVGLDFTLVFPSNSPYAMIVTWPTGNPANFQTSVKKQAHDLGIDLEKVTVEPVSEDEDKAVGMHLVLQAKGLRSSIRSGVLSTLSAVGRGGHPEGMTAALDDLLALRFDRCEINVKRSDDQLEITTDMATSHDGRFMLGYIGVYTEILERVQQVWHKLPENLLSQVQGQVALVRLRRLLPVLRQTYAGEGSAKLLTSFHFTNGGGHVKADGTFDMKADMAAFTAAMKAHHQPMADRQVFRASVRSQPETLEVRGDLEASGRWSDDTRELYVEAARQVKRLEFLAPLLSELKLVEGRMSLRISEGRVQTSGFVQTSDLGPLARALLTHFRPDFAGMPVAAEMQLINRGSPQSRCTVDLYLKDLPRQVTAAGLARTLSSALRAGRCVVRPVSRPEDVLPPPATPLP